MLDVLESYWLTYTAAWDDDNYSRHKITPVLELHGCSQATVHKAFPGMYGSQGFVFLVGGVVSTKGFYRLYEKRACN